MQSSSHWVHKRCNGLKSKLASAINFKCKACLDSQVGDDDYKAFELEGNEYEVVNQFCYLGDMISAGSCCCCLAPISKDFSDTPWSKYRKKLEASSCL